MASKKQKNPSTGEQDERNTVSVYDFLYHDAARVASFLSQFDNSGNLTQVVQGAGIARLKSDTGAGTVGGTALVVKGETSYTASATDEHRKDAQRFYDPLWANALTLLDYLSESDLIVRDISKARIGQFAIASGSLQVNDLNLVRKMLDLPLMKQLTAQPTPSGPRQAKKAKAAPNEMAMGLELMKIMPHSVQATVSSEVNRTWCTLRDECLTVSSSDLFLKHGQAIPGTWHVLGIADAAPQPDAVGTAANEASSLDVLQSGMGAVMASISPMARLMLGRPNDCYGITPLLIFREAEAN